jgi:site-specific recombinase XerD
MGTSNAQLIADFVAYLQIERGAKRNTIANYKHDVSHFSEWLGKPFGVVLRADLQRVSAVRHQRTHRGPATVMPATFFPIPD